MTTIDLSYIPFENCPSWYRNINDSIKYRGEARYAEEFAYASGFDIKIEYEKFGFEVTKRIISGEDIDIMTMILKWS